MVKLCQFLALGLIGLPLLALSARAADLICGSNAATDRIKVSKNGYNLRYETTPKEIVLGQPFELNVIICTDAGATHDGDLKIDARMPMHGHGMNYKPTISKFAPGTYKAKGMVLHMPGKWQFRFDFQANGKNVQLIAPHKQK